jgi:hypothetical protein
MIGAAAVAIPRQVRAVRVVRVALLSELVRNCIFMRGGRIQISLCVLRPMPNALAVFIHFPNAVKGHAMNLALCVCEPERLRVVFGEIQFSKRDDDDPALYAVKVAQLEVPMAKFGVPADAVQQFVNGGHRKDRSINVSNLPNFQPKRFQIRVFQSHEFKLLLISGFKRLFEPVPSFFPVFEPAFVTCAAAFRV